MDSATPVTSAIALVPPPSNCIQSSATAVTRSLWHHCHKGSQHCKKIHVLLQPGNNLPNARTPSPPLLPPPQQSHWCHRCSNCIGAGATAVARSLWCHCCKVSQRSKKIICCSKLATIPKYADSAATPAAIATAAAAVAITLAPLLHKLCWC